MYAEPPRKKAAPINASVPRSSPFSALVVLGWGRRGQSPHRAFYLPVHCKQARAARALALLKAGQADWPTYLARVAPSHLISPQKGGGARLPPSSFLPSLGGRQGFAALPPHFWANLPAENPRDHYQ